MRPLPQHLPGKAWSTIMCSLLINFCLVGLYAWSIWRAKLMGGRMQPGILPESMAASIYVLACVMFGLGALPGGLLTDVLGPRLPAIIGGLLFFAGLTFTWLFLNSTPYVAILLGFSIMACLGMGLAFGATVPASLKWARQHLTGFVAGLVVGVYGFLGIWVSPAVNGLINWVGLDKSFLLVGCLGVVMALAGIGLFRPGPDYVAPAGVSVGSRGQPPPLTVDRSLGEVFSSGQFYLLLFLFLFGVMTGLGFIGQLIGQVFRSFRDIRGAGEFLWVVPALGGYLNGLSRPTMGLISDLTGRHLWLVILFAGAGLSALVVPLCLKGMVLTPLVLIFFAGYWFYGSIFALLPALLVDFFGARWLGLLFGLLFFLGFGLGSPLMFGITSYAAEYFEAAGILLRHTFTFLLMGFLCLVGVALAVVSWVMKKPDPRPGG